MPLKRAWCLFEIFSSIEENTKLALRLPEGQQDELVSSLSTGDSVVLQHLGTADYVMLLIVIVHTEFQSTAVFNCSKLCC